MLTDRDGNLMQLQFWNPKERRYVRSVETPDPEHARSIAMGRGWRITKPARPLTAPGRGWGLTRQTASDRTKEDVRAAYYQWATAKGLPSITDWTHAVPPTVFVPVNRWSSTRRQVVFPGTVRRVDPQAYFAVESGDDLAHAA